LTRRDLKNKATINGWDFVQDYDEAHSQYLILVQ
jgi:hypothetical protein